MFAAEGVTDPAAWGQAAQALGPDRGVLIVALSFAALVILLWRGSKFLGIVGLGEEVRLGRQALEKQAREQTALRADFHIVVAWLARREGSEPPLPPLSPPAEGDGASIAPPPLPAPPDAGPTSRRAGRGPQPPRQR